MVVVVMNVPKRGVVSAGCRPAAVIRSPPTPAATTTAATTTTIGPQSAAPPPRRAEVVVVVHRKLVTEERRHAVVRDVAEPSVARLGERLAEHVQVVLHSRFFFVFFSVDDWWDAERERERGREGERDTEREKRRGREGKRERETHDNMCEKWGVAEVGSEGFGRRK